MSRGDLELRRAAAARLYQLGGMSIAAVARRLGEYDNFVKRAVKRYKETGGVMNRKGGGRPRKLEEIDIDRILHNKKIASSRAAARQIEREEGVKVSQATVLREARRRGLRYRVRPKKPLLTPRHRKLRLAFASERRSRNYWKRVVAVDEKTVSLYADTRGVWIREGEEVPPRETKKWPGGWKVWAGGSWEGKTRLHFLPRSFKGQDYVAFLSDEAIEDLLTLYPYHTRKPILLQDGDGFHTAKCVQNYLRNSPISSINNFPSHSPDLNWQENVWEMWMQGIRMRHPQTLDGLKEIMQDEWEKQPLSKIRSCVASMPRRLRAVIASKGGHTRY